MRRVGDLIIRIATRENLALAFHKAAKGKRHSPVVRQYADNLDNRLQRLVRAILDGSVTVGRFHRFVVCDPKHRVIHAASFSERVLHHAIMNICGPYFERGAIADSFACRLAKGNCAALQRAGGFARKYDCFLKLDVRRYFDSVNHVILKEQFRRLFKDFRLLCLLDRIVDTYETEAGKGLPIGTLTSQYFANFYLDPFDHFVKERLKCRGYLRFMDDFALWSQGKGQLQQWQAEVAAWLDARRSLELKNDARLGQTRNGMPFLGFRLMPNRVLVGRRARRRFRSRLKDYEQAHMHGRMSDSDLQRRLDAILAYTGQAQCQEWRRRVVTEVFHS
jgi:hypothetical protein